MEKRKPERRDRTAAPRPAATPPAIRHRTATRPFRAEKMQLRRSKCTTYDNVAFNLPIVAFTLSGDQQHSPDSHARRVPDLHSGRAAIFERSAPDDKRRTRIGTFFANGKHRPVRGRRRLDKTAVPDLHVAMHTDARMDILPAVRNMCRPMPSAEEADGIQHDPPGAP